ncbi:MAG: ubiquinone/menaquinone biosynthesis methyltransferase [Candidatus Latescibacteria bacterium]|nr:ubiquinone/menaquinone biosynthesis methyltransferase [Candidatus Latescibacterota bacterium]
MKEAHQPSPKLARSVQRAFSRSVSATYELVNHVLTFGNDALWRRKAARIGATSGGERWADLCTGTGETASYLGRLASSRTAVCAVDFSLPMMAEALKKPEARHIHFIVSDVRALVFPNETLDLITISFATRNINLSREVLVQTFAEFHRVLKPGGRFVNLETSQPSFGPLRRLYHLYIRLVVKRVGGLISGSYSAYRYLAHTIPRFYPPGELSDIMSRAGFENVTYKRLWFGIAAIHHGTKALDPVSQARPGR